MARSLLVIVVVAAGCAGTKRDTQTYRTDTQKVLETRTAQIQSCYETALVQDPTIHGVVTIQFVVEKKTGAFAKATIDPTKSTASQPLIVCVLDAVANLKLDPPDAHEGRATFVYELVPRPHA